MGQFEVKEDLSDEEDNLIKEEYSDDEMDAQLEVQKDKKFMKRAERMKMQQELKEKKHYALERISHHFRQDMMKLRRMYHEAKLKKEQVMKNDPFYDPP